ncbi:TIGR01777 family oxidoreductase [Pseudomonas sp. MAP12]|uniref:TIGR01777 family oxidoreductase n=1 Tax=Geopseudomonas aromaticivorans TaxID=2849492 RepID=A0ABS6MW34_9GAMM|nr:TIGR01777 family oxidoreductase [Pseudomonas aromaticivorans]MBV2132634.1 TIGR01777 family oxidoreductase [Pseudomonas aromaticivorans]
MRILLTGGTGLIGQALCRLWTAQGHELVVWSRRPEQVAALCSGARGIERLEQLDAGTALDAVVNLAGAPIADRPWTARRRQLLWDSRIDLTRQLVDWLASRPLKPRVLLSGSAVGWYGDGGERRLDEDSAPGSEDFASQLCFAWEQAAQQAEALGIRVVLIRTAPVLAGSGGMLARLLPPFRLGLGGRMGSGRQWMPWIHLDDEVGLIDFLLQHEECRGPYNACAPNALRNAEFAATLGRVLHRPALLPAPACVLRLALGEMSDLLLGGQHLQPRRTLDAGYHFRFPDLEAALVDLLGRH